MTLARERAMAIAYLISGDEDLREGVLAVQDMGVRVIVIGIPTSQPNQAQTLIHEADEHIMLDTPFWSPHFLLVTPPPPALAPAVQPTPATVPPPAVAQTHVITSKDAFQAGMEVALAWSRQATPNEIRSLLDQAPRIPMQLDSELLRKAEQTLGSLRDRQDLRKPLRAGFWRGIRQAAATPSSGSQT
jgi:hypothetical protein